MKITIRKRLKFKCWNCKKKYSLYKEADLAQKLIVACPYCGAEASVDFAPFRTQKKTILRSKIDTEQILGKHYQLPEILPTSKP